MSGHLDLDALADLLAGEGEDAQVDHVSGCGACSAALVDLERASAEVGAALAALPAPAVPEGLAARVDAALRAASREDAAGRAADLRLLPLGDEREAPPARPQRVGARPGRRAAPVLLGAAAAVAALALGGGAVAALLQGGGEDVSSAAAGLSGAPGPAPAPVGSSGRDYGPGSAGLAEALPALLDGPAPERSAAAGDASAPQAAEGAAAGTDRLRDPAALAACLSALPGPPGEVLALDHASYSGAPALVVVRAAATADRVRVAVVGPGCRAGSADARLLTELPAP